MKRNLYISAFILSVLTIKINLQAQTVTNVVAEQVGKTVEISYTLDKATEVRAEFSTDGKTYTPLKSVSGAVGKNVAAGRNKIVWNPLLDYDKMVYDNVWFRVVGMSLITSVTDCQGHTYPVVKIGSQYWMAENLQCTKYDTKSECAGQMLQTSSSGTYAPYYTDGRYANTEYSGNLTSEQRNHLGLLYNWAAAMGYTESQAKSQTGSYSGRRQGICPNGWHLPNRADWNTLANALGGVPETNNYGNVNYPNVGAKLKSRSGWHNGGNGTDDYGFSGLPAGYAHGSSVSGVGGWGSFWSSDAKSSDDAYGRYLNYSDSYSGEYNYSKYNAQSVRCLRD